ncbi:hypothetical protein AB3G33_15660 [Flavobacterium sp. WC2421]|uniref:hypothetical protein n=1 Tax=Flavobacterium sp. WC2421 TaxID=3234138 RepID=UPI003467E5AC
MMNNNKIFLNRIFLFLFLLGMVFNGYSQEEFSTKFKAIPPKAKEPKAKSLVPSIPGPPKVLPYFATAIPENNFKVPKSNVIVASEAYRRNQDLGVYKTSSKTARVQYRDGAYVDGDRIRIYVNYKVIDYDVLLDGNFKVFDVKLEKGTNRIDFEALNEGFAPPNTAEFQVYDDKGKLISSSQWNIGIGYMATIIINKE